MGRADGGGTPHDLLVQSWTMYAVGITLFLIRVYVRTRRLGWRWQAEDYLMCLAVAWYTAFVVTNIVLANGGGGSLYLPGQFATFTPADIEARVQFSKIEFASEQCMLNVIYTLKACMLFMYTRITSSSRHSLFVKICACYTFCAFAATEFALFFNCHPFSGYWTLPPPQEECATYFRYLVVQAVFNISSDLAILGVIIPMLLQLKMVIHDKLPLVIIFSMGFFLIICAIVSKIFTFRDVFDTSYQFWYLREASVGIYISNLPYIWGFVRQVLPSLRLSTGARGNSNGRNYVARPSMLSHNTFHHISSASRSEGDNKYTMRSDSEENIIPVGPGGEIGLNNLEPKNGVILCTTEVHVHREDMP